MGASHRSLIGGNQESAVSLKVTQGRCATSDQQQWMVVESLIKSVTVKAGTAPFSSASLWLRWLTGGEEMRQVNTVSEGSMGPLGDQ